MNRRSKKFSPKPSKLALSTLAALLALPTGQALANTSYPSVPLIWQSGATVIKPNILLFLDTSGSMAQTISAKDIYSGSQIVYVTDQWGRRKAENRAIKYTEADYHANKPAYIIQGGGLVRYDITNDKPRMVVAKEAISNVITETRDKNRWGLATFVASANSFSAQSNGYTTLYDAETNASGGKIQTKPDGIWYSIGSEILSEIKDIDKTKETEFQSLLNTVKNLPSNTNTPIPSAYYELIRYYRGLDTGSMPNLFYRGAYANGKYTSPIQYRCQKNYIIFISDGEPTGLHLRYQLGKLWHTDTLINKDSEFARQFRNHLRTANDTGVTPEIVRIAHEADLIQGGTDLEGKSFDDAEGSIQGHDFSKQNITTHTVAFGQPVALLERMAAKGGGKYFNANSPEELTAALIEATSSVARDSGFSAIAPAVTATTDGDGNTIVQAAISSIMSPTTWTSEIRFYKFNSATGKFDLSSYATPKYTPAAMAIFSTPEGVKTATTGQYNGFSNNLFGISPNRTDRVQDTAVAKQTITPIAVSSDSNEYQKLMNWLLRWGDSDTAVGKNYRNRGSESLFARYLGDISGDLLSFGDVSVRANGANDYDRKEFMAAPSNDGMLHIYQANTGSDKDANPYIEKLRYIPGTAQRDNANDTIMRNLVFTAEKTYGSVENPKQNFLADSLIYISTDEGKANNYSTHTVLGGFGSGARGAFAINVGGKDHTGANKGIDAAQGSWANEVPLWDTSTNKFGNANSFYNELGYHFGQVKVGYVADKGSLKGWKDSLAEGGNVLTAALMTSGFDSPSKSKLALYVLDHMGKNYTKKLNSAGQETNDNFATTTYGAGGLIKKIEINREFAGGNATGKEDTQQSIIDAHDGLTSPQGIDINNDNIVDLVYAGDYKGNIWRFDLRGDKDSWFAHQVYKSDGNQPLVAEPALLNWADGKVGIYFGTGSNLYQGDLTANGQQSLYGIFDDYKNCTKAGDTACTTVTKSDLIEQTMAEYNSEGFYISSKNAYEKKSERKGFYINVPAGYRVTTTPVALKVALRSNVGAAIWNIEKLSGASQALASCTPDMVSASGFRFIADAYSGQASRYVTWGKTYAKSQDVIIGSIPYKGSSSRSVLVTTSDSAVSQYGTLGSGKMPEREGVREPTKGCSGTEKLASGSTEEGTSLNDLECIPGTPIVRRVSWREIF
ncbi:pilus assembly protein [Wielerella bovis]|uniref:PilC/PilY family type IV pilus protein n=1 Tax=Wielerella bovis TaxID=2917790 RepID=UPI00201A1945|nr:PilC/PilY family type IV pilus protein [Wielerella bovis]ULJ62494.1 pilus assembly protein [Wielerella bovis]